jgi:hypothetical protein
VLSRVAGHLHVISHATDTRCPAAQVGRESMASTGKGDGLDVRTMNSTLRNIGYAAAMVGGASATVYALAKAVRTRDMSNFWAYDEAAAPPRALQQELLGIPDSAEMRDDRRVQGRWCMSRPGGGLTNDHYLGASGNFDEEVHRAVDAGGMGRVPAFARQRQPLEASYRATHEDAGVRPRRLHPQGAGAGALEDDDYSTHRLSSHRAEPGALQTAEYGRNGGDDVGRTRACRKSSRNRCMDLAEDATSACEVPEYGDDELPSLHNAHRALRRRSDEPRTDWYNGFRGRGENSEYSEHSEARTRTEQYTTHPLPQANRHDDPSAVPSDRVRDSLHTDTFASRSPAPSRSSRSAPLHDGPVGSGRHEISSVGRPKGRGPAACVAAEAEFRVNDLVKAECPCTGAECDATISALSGNGLVTVRWHNPGFAPDGRSFHPLGDVWADKMRLVFRKDQASPGEGGSHGAPVPPTRTPGTAEDMPDGLQPGDRCFAVGYMLEKKWFQARVLSVRAKDPRLRVEYMATLEGEKSTLALPEPRKAHVYDAHVSREKPPHTVPALSCVEAPGASAHAAPKLALREVAGEMSPSDPTGAGMRPPPEAAAGRARPVGGSQTNHVDESVDDDLMCAVCSRPDDEARMLVCDCKKGYHIYCLSPPLASVPEGKWHCPACVKKASASADA